MGSASLEALYAALGVINGFMHLTGKLRNSDVAVAIGVANALNTGIYVSPVLNELKTSEIVKIEKIVIARRNSEIWKIVDEL
jgi:myo-inositol-1(or 4)-monophosphatase